VFLLFIFNVVAASGYKAIIPYKASDFIHSIGVNTHFGYYDTQYGLYEDVLKPRLIESGIKHIRDGTYNEDVLQKYRDVGQYGIRLLLITRPSRAIHQAKSIGPMLWGMEAINEPDVRKEPGTWEEFARNEQQQLFETIKNDEATKHIPVVGLSLANIRDNPARLGDISQWMDYGGMHPYAAGQHPSNHWGWGLSMEKAISTARLVSGEKPLLATECGYHNKTDNPHHPGVSEKAAAIYHIHLPFVYFNEGITRSYKYEFLDLKPDPKMTDMECHFGLIRSDGTPKPSFYALKNLLEILEDEEINFTVAPLMLHINTFGDEKVEYTLLQKSDGSYWLALFRNVTVFELDRKEDIDPVSIPVQLRFKKAPRKISLYMPNVSDQFLLSLQKQKQLDLSLGSELLLIEIEK
jgi:hypothetical protein